METTFECWTITATLARDTERVKIGQMVGCNGYRNPALYAKIASTVDVASHGRLYAGIGAGWYEHEWRAYGYGCPRRRSGWRSSARRSRSSTRCGPRTSPVFQGKHYTIDKPINEPKGVRKPHPPLWIGGGGEQVTLKLVAQYGDACNVGGGNPEVIRHKLEVLKRHCDALGRDYDEIIKSTEINACCSTARPTRRRRPRDPRATRRVVRGVQQAASGSGTSDEIAEQLRPVIDAGIDYVIFYIPASPTTTAHAAIRQRGHSAVCMGRLRQTIGQSRRQ